MKLKPVEAPGHALLVKMIQRLRGEMGVGANLVNFSGAKQMMTVA